MTFIRFISKLLLFLFLVGDNSTVAIIAVVQAKKKKKKKVSSHLRESKFHHRQQHQHLQNRNIIAQTIIEVGCTDCKYQTLQEGRDAVREIILHYHRRRNNKQRQQQQQQKYDEDDEDDDSTEEEEEEEILVKVYGGTHPPITFDPILDSGTTKLTVRYQGIDDDDDNGNASSRAKIDAGLTIPKETWKPWKKTTSSNIHDNNSDNIGLQVNLFETLGLTIDDLGSLPSIGDVHTCDQLTYQRMNLYHSIDPIPLRLGRYPNIDRSTGGKWNFLNAVDSVDEERGGGFIVSEEDSTRILEWQKNQQNSEDDANIYVHGYWEWDWDDSIMKVSNITQNLDTYEKLVVEFVDDDENTTTTTKTFSKVKPNARYYGFNILSEVDQPGEYYIAQNGTLYYLPLKPMDEWTYDPVVSVSSTALNVSGCSYLIFENFAIENSKAFGVIADNVNHVTFRNMSIQNHGGYGIKMVNATNSGIIDSIVNNIGCTAIQIHGGDMLTLSQGNVRAVNNTITNMALYKRTYQPGIHWGGVSNYFAYNYVGNSPHNCILGGGNEADGVDCIFEYNHLDKCTTETSDVGAFYTCGQQATAFVCPGNEIRHNLFTNIQNVGPVGVQPITTQAIYLDDQMSGYNIWNNTFVNCTRGTFVGGGRNNFVHSNYYENCDLAHHFDNRGMTSQKSTNCASSNTHNHHHYLSSSSTTTKGSTATTTPPSSCHPRTGNNCTCNAEAVMTMYEGPAGIEWQMNWPELFDSTNNNPFCSTIKDGLIPCYNQVVDNTYCNVKQFINAKQKDVREWHSTVKHNQKIQSCRYNTNNAEGGGDDDGGDDKPTSPTNKNDEYGTILLHLVVAMMISSVSLVGLYKLVSV